MSSIPVRSVATEPLRRARRAGVRGLSAVESYTGLSEWAPGQHDAVLMYHSVGDSGRFGNVPVERLRRDLEYLTTRFEVVDLPELADSAETKRVALTFDDAYASFYDHALPLVREFDVPVTVFVPVGFVEGEHAHLDYRFTLSPTGTTAFNDPDAHREVQCPPADVMTTAQLEELVADPLVTLGNHTATHPDLGVVTDRETLEREILGAKSELESHFGVTVDRFCFPYGRYTQEALSMVRDSHTLSVTVEPGLVGSEPDPHLLSRLHAHVPESRFRADLTDVRWWPRRALGG